MNHIDFVGLNQDTLIAGPGVRLELFTKGCHRGVVNPCDGCFNPSTWTFEGKKARLTIDEVAESIRLKSWNKLLTFCGGEPILQGRALIQLIEKLKLEDRDYHILLYTSYKWDKLMKLGLSLTWMPAFGEAMKNSLREYSFREEEISNGNIIFHILTKEEIIHLTSLVNIIVDGTYRQDQRLTVSDTMHDGWFIGSANQRVIDGPSTIMKGELIYQSAESYNQEFFEENRPCYTCMEKIPVLSKETENFCSSECEHLYDTHLEDINILVRK